MCHRGGEAGRWSELGFRRFLTSPPPPPTVVFPQDLLEKGLEADNFAMLGLGDIVIPGDGDGVGAAGRVVEGLKGGAGAL